MSIKKRVGIINDFGLNIVASLIITVSTQIIVYPYLSRIMTYDEYGLLLTIMAVATASGVALGNPLNNTRLLLQKKYEDFNVNGDYNLLFILALIANVLIVSVTTKYFFTEDWMLILYLVIISSLILFRAYFSVSYRITLDYKKILKTSIFGFLGYIMGLLITYLTGNWMWTFLCGELLSCIYIFCTSIAVKEKFSYTKLFQISLNKYLLILSAGLISTLMMYMDRFFLYPFLGSSEVTTYTVASFLGKTAGILMTPISSVLLSYYVKVNYLSLIDFYNRLGIFTGVAIIIYGGILIFGYKITYLLYPTIYANALPYFAVANLASIIFILGNTIQPTMLRFASSKWQLILQVIYFFSYISFSVLGIKLGGLMGFCYAIVLANTIKIALMVLITHVSLIKYKNTSEI